MNFEDYSRTFLHFHTKEVPPLLVKHLQDKQNFSLLDMGAGDGVLLTALKMGNYLTKAKEVVAVDLSPERCERLEKYTDFKVICADVTNVASLPPSSFDYLICTQVIEHVDEDKLLTEIKRVLRPGGVVYIASLIKKWYGWWYYRTAEGKWALDPTHLREYASKEQYEGVIAKAGFTIVETQVSSLKLSLIEFIVRRIVTRFMKIESINSYFLKRKFADVLRRKINIYPPGYFIIETIATK